MARTLLLAALAIFACSCGHSPAPTKSAEAPNPAPKPKPADESRRFPQGNLRGTEVVSDAVWGKPFMPGGTVGKYRRGKGEYEMFVSKQPTPTDAAIRLLDWKRTMGNAKLIPSFGGYFGDDAGTPVFVFTKGDWLAGVRGLDEKEADAQARLLAVRL